MDTEDCTRLGVCAAALQVFICGEFESRSVINMTKLVNAGLRYGIPTLVVTAVGKEMVRDAQYFRLATRICAELGANYVKTYYVDKGFETVTSSCPVPTSSPAARSCPRWTRSRWRTGPSAREPWVLTWDATSSSPIPRWG